MRRLRQNFNKGNWNTELELVKMKADYTPTSPSKSYEMIRLADEHVPVDEDNYIPMSPVTSSPLESSYEKDYEIARTSPAAVIAKAASNVGTASLNNVNQALQTVSKQLNDVQSQVSNYTQSAKNLATDVIANVSSNAASTAKTANEVASEAVKNASEVASEAAKTASAAANTASEVASNASVAVTETANNFGNKVMDIVEGQKPLSSILTNITGEPEVKKEEEKKSSDVKRIVM